MKVPPAAEAKSGVHVSRRTLLGATTAACTLGFSLPALADALTAEQREKLAPDQT
jgi:hypothetical protein